MGKKNGKTKKPLPLPSALKATNGTIINDNNHLSHSSRVADHVILKLLKVLAEKPQCKSISNARNVPTDPTLRMLPKDFLSPKSLCWVCTVHALNTLTLWATCPLGLGELDLAVRFTCRDSYTSHQEHRWQMYSMTLVQAREECLRPGYSLHEEARPGLHSGHTAENRACMYTVGGVTIQGHKAHLPGSENGRHADHA